MCGSIEFKFHGRPFANCSGKEASAAGKVFAGKVLGRMAAAGYELVISTELSFWQDHSTWFFHRDPRLPPKKEVESSEAVCSITLRPYDRMYVMCGDDEGFFNLIRNAMEEGWRRGIQGEKVVGTRVGKVRQLKLKGSPWSNKGEEGAEGHGALITVIGRLGGAGWKMLAATNLKGFLATLYFVREAGYSVKSSDLAMLSPHNSDRVRLVHFDKEDREAVRRAIAESLCQAKEPDEKVYPSGCGQELRLQGSPLDATGKASVASRRLMCRTMEALARRGWECSTTITVSLYDRSAFLFRRASSAASVPRVGCLALSVSNELRLLDFPEEDRRAFRASIIRGYLPGIERERQGGEEASGDGNCLELRLRGEPFGDSTSYGLHGRSMLTGLLRVAKERGWRLVASGDVSANRGHDDSGATTDVHSWFFYKDQGAKHVATSFINNSFGRLLR